jgi:predicted ArsR family transcriptional regulator
LQMHDDGAQSGEIAAKLGRDPRGFYHTVKREFLAREEQAKAAQNDTAPPLGALSSADRKLDQRLNTLGFAGKWSDPADSLALVEGLGKGVKLAQIALDLGIDAQVCRFRFDDLVPHKSIEEQAAVMAALRRRVAARQAAAA